MKFAVGYQLAEPGEERFPEVVRDYREHVAEVYFPWLNVPTGRASLTTRRGYTDWSGQERLEEDLRALREMGVRLDLLLNANCYGRWAASQFLENMVGSILERLEQVMGGADIVTTTSPAVARTVQRHFPEVEVRASVNMRIGTPEQMRLVSGLFDSFHVQRDYNRDLEHLDRVIEWARDNGKRLTMLANSGCLRRCPGQVFHDNMVAHEAEIDETENIPGWTPYVCWSNLKKRENWPILLQATWVRPEDLHHYEGRFEVVKLATRQHARPRLVLHAYSEGEYAGNLLDLFEPGFGPALAPFIVDNSRFPHDWFERTTTCGCRCTECDYCAEVLEQTLVRVPG